MDELAELKQAINDVWIKAYGGEVMNDVHALKCRVQNLSTDRECWIFNARVSEKECKRLNEEKTK